MPFSTISTVQLQPARPITTDLISALYNRDEDLNARVGSIADINISNPSFEVLSGTNPANWTITLFTGGTYSVDTSIVAHGGKSLKFTHPGGAGNGGGQGESDLFPVTTSIKYVVGHQIYNTVVGVRNKVLIRPYDKNLTTLPDSTYYDTLSSAHGTGVYADVYATYTPPSSARFVKVIPQGGTTDTDPGALANIYFDNITMKPKTIKSVTGGSYIIIESTARRGTKDPTYIKLKEQKINLLGSIKIHYEAAYGGDVLGGVGGGYFQIWRNGSAIGTETTLAANGTGVSTAALVFTTISTVISGWKPDDLVQIYAHRSTGANNEAAVKNMRLQVANPWEAGYHEDY